jgi:regulator of telomere elongation helicase 1
MKDRAAGADVIFMPYNYLIDDKIRENFQISFENCIMIFDEAHNITSTCEDAASFVIETKVLEQSITELHELED